MNRIVSIPVAAACLALACGCQQTRRIIVTSEPSGARVSLNSVDVGLTPVEVDFTWFGTYEVRLSKPGYEPLIAAMEAEPRLHDQPGLDLFASLIPGGTETIIQWHFELIEQDLDQNELLDRAESTRTLLEPPYEVDPRASENPPE